MKSPIYIFCLITVILYGAVAGLLVWGQIHYFRDDGACKIGLRKIASLSLLSYDLFINLLLTTLFLWPLFRARFLSSRIKRVALRTLLAAGVALTTSTVNIAVLTILNGEQLGWVCLGSCGTDVLFNAMAIYWVTATVVRPTTTTTADTKSRSVPDNADSNRRSVPYALPSVNGSIPNPGTRSISNPGKASLHTGSISNPGKSSQLTVQPEGTSAEHHLVSPERGGNGEGSTQPSFFKSIWSTLSRKKAGDESVVEISVRTTTEYEMDPVPQGINMPRSLRKSKT